MLLFFWFLFGSVFILISCFFIILLDIINFSPDFNLLGPNIISFILKLNSNFSWLKINFKSGFAIFIIIKSFISLEDEIKGCKFKLIPFILISIFKVKFILSGLGFSFLHILSSFPIFFSSFVFFSSKSFNFSNSFL